jgi:hypothetical protein
VENVLPLLREQMTTTDSYISHVSQVKSHFEKNHFFIDKILNQQLTELVKELRSLEKYILSYTNSIPLIDDGKNKKLNLYF